MKINSAADVLDYFQQDLITLFHFKSLTDYPFYQTCIDSVIQAVIKMFPPRIRKDTLGDIFYVKTCGVIGLESFAETNCYRNH